MTSTSAQAFFELAAAQARQSLCLDKKCGAIIVADDQVIGAGFNGPPKDDLTLRRCHITMDKQKMYPSDKSCCIHAEQRAVYKALTHDPKELEGADLFYVSVDKDGNICPSGLPWCTHCSKLALDVGIDQFWLWHEQGPQAYPTNKYNILSFASSARG